MDPSTPFSHSMIIETPLLRFGAGATALRGTSRLALRSSRLQTLQHICRICHSLRYYEPCVLREYESKNFLYRSFREMPLPVRRAFCEEIRQLRAPHKNFTLTGRHSPRPSKVKRSKFATR